MHYRHWVRIIAPLLVFAMVGTIGTTLLLKMAFESQWHSEFLALAEADADYIRDSIEAKNQESSTEIPVKANADFSNDARAFQKEFAAGRPDQFSGVEIYFRRMAAPDARHEVATVPINSDAELTLIRVRPRLRDVLVQPISWCALTAFWTLWFALAWAVILPSLEAQRFGLLGSIATSLAHEIRNPIAAIRLHGQLLEQAEPVGARLIVSEAARIEDILNQWMFLTRPEPPRKTEVDLAELIKNIVNALTPAADHAKVWIEINATSGRRIQADISRLAQVFHNVILNAIQAMPEGGTLFITVSEKEISFADTGHGFSPTALKRAATTLYSEKEGGMGLGLSVARKIIRAHDGQIVISNRKEGGALVRVVL